MHLLSEQQTLFISAGHCKCDHQPVWYLGLGLLRELFEEIQHQQKLPHIDFMA